MNTHLNDLVGYNRADFYGLTKRWSIKFIIFFTPTNYGINAMDEFIANRVDYHSDQGVQYCLWAYLQRLWQANATESGDPTGSPER